MNHRSLTGFSEGLRDSKVVAKAVLGVVDFEGAKVSLSYLKAFIKGLHDEGISDVKFKNYQISID